MKENLFCLIFSAIIVFTSCSNADTQVNVAKDKEQPIDTLQNVQAATSDTTVEEEKMVGGGVQLGSGVITQPIRVKVRAKDK